jgi:hypothetical protein
MRLLLPLILGLLAAPLSAEAQRVGKVVRIGVLEQGGAPGPHPITEAFRQQLRADEVIQ